MNQIPSAVYVTVATSVVLAIMYAVTKRTGFFTRHQKVHESKTLEELNKEYAKWDVLSRFVYLGLAALCTYSAFLPLKYIAGRFQPPVSEGILYIYASNSYWLVTALFSGLFLAIIPMYVLSKLIPSDRMHEYDCYMDMKAGVNLNRLGLVFSVMMILLLTVMIFFGLRFYWVFEKKEFALNPVTRLTESRYDYSDITELRYVLKMKAPSGSIKTKPHFELVTNDGKRWNSYYAPNNRQNVMKALFDRLAEKTNRNIIEYEIAPENLE